MLTGANPIAFVATTDAERARDFYEGTLELTLVEETPFALVFEARGTELRVTPVERLEPAGHTVLGWSVASAEGMARKLIERGVPLERFDSLEQDELGIWDAPGGARVAWFRDPDGNLLSITQV
jgi:catechol 2,3-dioxygenase-like lactoylglutathione lyase family enzyme